MLSLIFFKNTFLLSFLLLFSCGNEKAEIEKPFKTGANQLEVYLPKLQNKKVGVVANQTSVIFKTNGHTHLVDSLLRIGVDVQRVFAPEHGFRGKADAGEHVKDGKDKKTGLSIISLYGSNKKPKPEQLQGIDIMVFDIQDVGVRFYTYISTLHYIMEACAEQNIPVLVLDRPNPNGSIVDGPILEKEYVSFVGMHQIPVLHGMTIGEYAKMINGEKWLKNGAQCDLQVVKCQSYVRDMTYSLLIKPSPNLPNDQAINLYPSLCFFEGTNVSVGRGTDKQFQVYGAPWFLGMKYEFTPRPNEGAKHPKHNEKVCYGENLSNTEKVTRLELRWLLNAYRLSEKKENFFNSFFNKLSGNSVLKKQVKEGIPESEIRASWVLGIEQFKKQRRPYLLY